MRWVVLERLTRWTVALIVIAVWLGAVIEDARSESYTVPRELTGLALVALTFVLGVDTVVALVQAWRRNGNGHRNGRSRGDG